MREEESILTPIESMLFGSDKRILRKSPLNAQILMKIELDKVKFEKE